MLESGWFKKGMSWLGKGFTKGGGDMIMSNTSQHRGDRSFILSSIVLNFL